MNQDSFIYKLLFTPSFKIWRYTIAVLFIGLASFNQAVDFYSNDNISPLHEDKIDLIIIISTLSYIIIFYLVLAIFTPRYFSTGKYFQFIVCIILNAVFYTIIPNIILLIYSDKFELFSIDTLISNLSSFIMYVLCLSGVIIPLFLRNWMISNQHLNQLKNKYKISEIEQLKEQINPNSFFKILNQSGSLVKSEPEKASTMLMKLGLLLRYQLYDCNRNQVLLTAEISFLKNFLELESLYFSNFKYTITIGNDINAINMPPSILLPYVQSATNVLDRESNSQNIDIHINIDDKYIIIDLVILGASSILLLKKELLSIKERLHTLYKNHNILNISDNSLTGEINLSLKLDRQ